VLPRIKFRNPAIPVQISRHTIPDGPSVLHIYTKPAASTTPPTDGAAAGTPTPPSGTPNARNTQTPDTTPPAHTLKIRDLHSSEILRMLIEKTGAVVVEATPEEKAQMTELADLRERSDADRVLVREKLLKERREAELLKLARGEVPTAA
jgi:large subunit ribosomal protein MRP49